MEFTATFNTLEELEVFLAFVAEHKSVPEKKKPKKEQEPVRIESEKTYADTAPEPGRKEAPAEPEKKEAAAGHTETEIKLLLSEKLKAGRKQEVKDFFAKYGVSQLSELLKKHGDKLDELYAEAEVI